MAVRQVGKAERFQYLIAQLRFAGSEQHFLTHTVRKQLIIHILHDHEALFQTLLLFCRRNRSGDRFQKTSERFRKRTFSYAVVSHQPHNFSFADGKIFDLIHRAFLSISNGQMICPHNRHSIRCRFLRFLSLRFPIRIQLKRSKAHFRKLSFRKIPERFAAPRTL